MGVIGHATIMATVIVRSARASESFQQWLTLSLALVPLIRVIDLSLSLSLIPIPTIGRFPIIYTPLLVASVVVVVRTSGYRWIGVGLNFKSLPAQLGIASSGLLFGWVDINGTLTVAGQYVSRKIGGRVETGGACFRRCAMRLHKVYGVWQVDRWCPAR